MEILYSWLKEYIDLKISANEAVEILTNLGVESSLQGAVPGSLLSQLEKVVIARIEKIEKHPNADKLLYCQVRPAKTAEALPIVCGAHNIKEGDMAPLALPGAKLPEGLIIKESIIRKVVSKGMLCSEKELGLSEDYSGIMILPQTAPLGVELKEWLANQDMILSIDSSPNRGDLLSVVGIARELCAKTNSKLKIPEIKIKEDLPSAEDRAKVLIEDYIGCPRYVARIIEGVKIAPSPEWMRKRLEASGIRSISNIVDITNYVMLELGQPLHAFDLELLRGKKIIVRRASAGEKFTTLDGIERTLSEEILLICDGEGPVAVAGIMGGADSEVSGQTANILLESAFFDPVVIRKGAIQLGMQTEASKRFERGVDPRFTDFCADRAGQLFQELAGGKVLKGKIDVYEKLFSPEPIRFRTNQVKRILGFSIEPKQIEQSFKSLEMKVEKKNGEGFIITPPSFRGDIKQEIDLIEEVARLYGYEKIEPEMPEFKMQALKRSKKELLRRRLRTVLVQLGFSEVLNLNFQGPKDPSYLGLKEDDPKTKPVRISNPLAENSAYLRTSLIPGLISNLAFNLARQQARVKIFELNKVFFPSEKTGELLNERESLAGLLAEQEVKSLWQISCSEGGFYELKRAVELILEQLKFTGARIEPVSDVPYLLPGKTAKIMLGKDRAGALGEVKPLVLKNFDLSPPVFIFELDIELLLSYERKAGSAFIPSRYPGAYRDISLMIGEELPHQAVIIAIRGLHNELISAIELFDIYRGKKLPSGKKSLAYRIWYQSPERTLTEEEINALHAKVAMRLKEKLGAEIR